MISIDRLAADPGPASCSISARHLGVNLEMIMVDNPLRTADEHPKSPAPAAATPQVSKEEELREGVRPGGPEPQADDADLGGDDDDATSKPAPAAQPIPSGAGSEDPTPSEKSADE